MYVIRYHSDQHSNSFRHFVEQLTLYLLHKDITRDILNTDIARILDTNAAAYRLFRMCLALTTIMSTIAPFVKKQIQLQHRRRKNDVHFQ